MKKILIACVAMLLVGACGQPQKSGAPPYSSASPAPYSAPVAAAEPKESQKPKWQCKGVMVKIGTFGDGDSFASDCTAGPNANPRLNAWNTVGSLPHVLKDATKPELSFDLLSKVVPNDVVVDAKRLYAAGSIKEGHIKKGDVMAAQGFGATSVWQLIKANFQDRESVLWKHVVVERGDYVYLVGIVPEDGQPDGKKGCNNPTVVIKKRG